MTISPIEIDFAVRGLTDVGRAFDTVEQRIARFEKQADSQAQKGAKSRVRSSQTEAKERDAAYRKLTDDVARREKQMGREADAEARRRQNIQRKSSEMAGKFAEQTAKAEARAAQEGTRAIEREAERRIRIQRNSSEMAGRIAARAAAEEARAQEAAFNARGRAGRRVGRVVAGSLGSTLSGIGTMATATLGIGGGMLLADAGRREMSAQQKAALLVNAVTTGGAPPPGANVGAILGKAGQLSKETGLDKTDLVGAALEYSRNAKGGDFAGAMGNMGFFAKMAQTTGADINELAGSAGILQSQNPNLGSSETQQMMLDMYAQSKAGSLSMPEIAKMAGELGSTRSSYAGDAGTNQRKLIGLAQLARSEVASPEEAGVAIKDLSLEAGKHRKSTASHKGLEAMGVKFNEHGQMESIEQMVNAVFTDTKGDVTKIQDALGSQRATPLFRALAGKYNDAGGGQAGLTKVNEEMAKVTGATMSQSDLDTQHAQIMSTSAEKFHVALNRVIETLEEKMEPRLQSFADKLDGWSPTIDKIIDDGNALASWFMDNPIYGIGGVILASVTKDVAAAQLGQALKGLFAQAFQGLGGGGGAAGSAASGAGAALQSGGALAGALQGAGVLGLAGNIATGGDEALLAHKTTKNDELDPSKGSFWKTLPGAFKKKYEDIKEHPLDFLFSDPSKQTAAPAGAGGAPAAPGSAPSNDAARAQVTATKESAASLDKFNKQLAVTTGQLATLGAAASNANPNAPQRNGPR